MAKKPVFFSFHFEKDVFRVGQVRNMGVIEGNEPVSSNEWEEVKKKGDANIQRWIDDQLKYKQCTIVLIGSETHQRPWVKYEINRSWELNKGVVGIHIHNLKCARSGLQTTKGPHPFTNPNIKIYDPPYYDSKQVYEYISTNIESWVDEAIQIRKTKP
jgi:hypothetical protein